MERYLSRNDSSRRQTMEVADFDPSRPELFAASLDDEILRLRRLTSDPAQDRSKSLQERLQYMPDAPSYNDASSRGDPNTPRPSVSSTEYLAHKSHKEKLSSWVSPATNDCSEPRNVYNQSNDKLQSKN